MSQAHPGVAQEGKRERRVATHTPATRSNRAAEFPDVRWTEIGQFADLQVAPEQFDRIEFWGVRGERLNVQPGTLPGEMGSHAPTLVRVEAVPDQDDALAAEVPPQSAHEADQGRVGICPGLRLKIQAGPAAIPSKGQGGRDRQPFPVPAGVAQDRGLAAGRPRASHHRLLRHPAFVFEDYPGALASRVFFTCGHRWRRHCRIAASSRSRAWRAGRCSDQLSPRRIRQTWAG